MNGYIGIVLKHHIPYKNMCTLLDSVLGKITAILMHDYVSAGTLIQYSLATKQDRHYIDSIEYIQTPLMLARSEMLFLHYIFEMCLYFAPEQVRADRLFELLIFVCKKEALSYKQKKIILCLLLALLELYPENAIYECERLYTLSRLPLDHIFEEKIDTTIEKNIAGWLYQSIEGYPGVRQFKTIHFLNEIK